MKKLVFIALLAAQILFSQNKDVVLVPKETLSLVADTFYGYDVLGSYYYAKNNVLYKKSKGQLLQYQNVSLGKISKVDTYNPLMLLVFYENFNTVVLLDSQLNEIKTINFNDLETPVLASAVAISSQNEIYFYDSLSLKIGLLNVYSLKANLISNVLEFSPKEYSSNYTHFIWKNQEGNIYAINRFGAVSKLCQIDCANTYINNYYDILCIDGSKITSYDNTGKITQNWIVENYLPENLCLKNGILSIFTKNKIANFIIQK